ncbi:MULTISPECIES: AMP-dependent synthetase/ligase [Mycolicibacterium]|uniref:Acyl-CoA synthetase n=3 Tax=Mycolicibacterium gilvum TaxID=1804 RepID=E6TG87_MYCSR|nr:MULTISPECIES: long-chain fatty acid--CoA ligase [Mycolicibacterium]ABP45439.1 AMP-dependent synthetase and ligase [Mycolicibacterium gilvum PYR-GCK]ADT98940.1 AMP-forming long-chain acyl-CoA synthetase [Mycolicibacterium gilvum Spyr1]MBV5243271.1 long-chain fatty acid--CoA ligase [Mycolicibacterium sp. PAM1]MCV7055565.1 long-chain fatty acid--CoA ligase [Mycolicibacterium gilvum]STZ44252.1 AMP-dependent synthetase and ligase [Mycolicibacterium gilvum]
MTAREFTVPAPFTVEERDNIVGAVFTHERDDPDHVIFQRLVDGKWIDVTARQAAGQIRSAARGLIAEGVQAGDRVALLSATRYEWPILDFAILSIGAVTVPIYETSSAEQVQFVLADSGAVAAIAETDAHAAHIEAQRDTLPALRRIYVIDGSVPALDELAEAGASVDAAAVDERVASIRSTDAATLIYTSGTTGRPKGCQLTHSNLLYEIRGAKACFPEHLAKGEKLLVFLPLAHVLARALTIGAFSNGVTLGFTSDIKNLVPMFAVFQPTLVVSVPRVFEKVYNTAELNAETGGKGKIFTAAANTAIEYSKALDSGGPGLVLKLKHALFDKLVYGKLRAALGGRCHAAISGGAPLGARLGHFYRGVGLSIYEGYGLTETSAAITVNRVGDLRVGSVGKLVPGNSMRLGEDGELLVRGGVVFNGYWGNEEETRAVFTDGWFHTGDLGAIDDDGFLTIVGRKKEIIVTAGGKNVAPAQLEDRLRAHPLISQAMAVGDQQPFIAALITVDTEAFPGWKERHHKASDASVADLADDPDLLAEIELAVKDANQAVSKAEAIRKFRILPVDFTEDTGELTPTLKVKRKVVAEKFAADIEALYAKG